MTDPGVAPGTEERVAAAVTALSPSPSAFVSVLDLGATLGYSWATDINNAGVVVGVDSSDPSIYPGAFRTLGFVWTEQGGKAYLPGAGPDTFPAAISQDGVIAGISGLDLDQWLRGFRFDPATDSQIQPLANGWATAVNRGGTVAGSGYFATGLLMFRSNGTTIEELPPAPAPGYESAALASAIDDDGTVVGTVQRSRTTSDGAFTAARYSDARGLEVLNDLLPEGSGWDLRAARSISHDVIVGWGYQNGLGRAYRLSLAANGDLMRIDNLGVPGNWPAASPFVISIATDVNASGVIVGGVYDQWPFWPLDAFVVPADGSGDIINLNSYVDPSSGWHLEVATAINDLGDVVGMGSLGGERRAFKLRLPNTVPCPAPADACAGPARRNPESGQCEADAPLADGTACDDHSLCTDADTCHAGVCAGTPVVTCTALDQCHGAGQCDPGSGLCSNPALPDGFNCDDDNRCTQADACQAGVCTGASAIACSGDECHEAGTCDPQTGVCSTPPKPDGTACLSIPGCEGQGVCGSGICTLSASVAQECQQLTASALDLTLPLPPTASFDWIMSPHFPGTDAITVPVGPPPTECPPASASSPPKRCTLGGRPGCVRAAPPPPAGVAAKPLLNYCDTSFCSAPGQVTPCGRSGVATCQPNGRYGTCKIYETCDGIDSDHNGKIDDGQVCIIPHSQFDPAHGPGWDAILDACASQPGATSGMIQTYRWALELVPGGPPSLVETQACRLPYVFPHEGSYPVELTAVSEMGIASPVVQKNVVIRNHLIVSMGDSIASGEGNPDVEAHDNNGYAIWDSQRCHRSMKSWHAVAARAQEDADPHSSVTFLSTACSGASISEGLLGPYRGEEPDGTWEPPQVEAVRSILGATDRQIDALFLQIGANDLKFADQVRSCAVPTIHPAPLSLVLWLINPTAGTALLVLSQILPPDFDLTTFMCHDTETLRAGLSVLSAPGRGYAALGTAIGTLKVRPSSVYISPYPNPFHGEDNGFCSELRLEDGLLDGVIESVPSVAEYAAAVGTAFQPGAGRALEAAVLTGGLELIVQEKRDGVISGDEVMWGEPNFLQPLNDAVRAGALANGWTFVDGINDRAGFGTHGYCASPGQRWLRHRDESKRVQGNDTGTLHPNVAGHQAYAKILLARLAKADTAGGSACGTSSAVGCNCAPGFADCDGDPANGCETNMAADGNNCGGCGARCWSSPDGHVSGICFSYLCSTVCDPGYASCDSDPNDGCEATSAQIADIWEGELETKCPGIHLPPGGDLRRAPQIQPPHMTCPGGIPCFCAPGFTDCDGVGQNGCEVETGSDRYNCGTCGAVCGHDSDAARNVVPVCFQGACYGQCLSNYYDCNDNWSDGCETPSDRLEQDPITGDVLCSGFP